MNNNYEVVKKLTLILRENRNIYLPLLYEYK